VGVKTALGFGFGFGFDLRCTYMKAALSGGGGGCFAGAVLRIAVLAGGLTSTLGGGAVTFLAGGEPTALTWSAAKQTAAACSASTNSAGRALVVGEIESSRAA